MDEKLKQCLMIATIVGNFTVVGAVLFVWFVWGFLIWFVWAFLIGLAVFGVVFAAMYALT